MAELQTEMTPLDGQISNDVPGSVRVASATSGGTIIVTDEATLSNGLGSLAKNELKIGSYDGSVGIDATSARTWTPVFGENNITWNTSSRKTVTSESGALRIVSTGDDAANAPTLALGSVIDATKDALSIEFTFKTVDASPSSGYGQWPSIVTLYNTDGSCFISLGYTKASRKLDMHVKGSGSSYTQLGSGFRLTLDYAAKNTVKLIITVGKVELYLNGELEATCPNVLTSLDGIGKLVLGDGGRHDDTTKLDFFSVNVYNRRLDVSDSDFDKKGIGALIPDMSEMVTPEVLDAKMDKLEKNLHRQFNVSFCKYREVVENLDTTIAESATGPVYRIPSIQLDEDGVLHCACDARKSGSDQEPIEVVYGKTTNGGKTWLRKKVVGLRYSRNNGNGDSNKYLNYSRVMDPTILHAGNNKIFILAGRWTEGNVNWVGDNVTSRAWSAALLIKSTDNGDTWTQHTIGRADCDTQEGTHITVENLPSDLVGFLGGIDAGLRHSSGKLVFGIQMTRRGGGCFSGLLVSSDGGDTWRMGSSFTDSVPGSGNCYEPSILELPDGRIVLHTRADTAASNNKSMKRAFVTSDFGETWSVYEPLNQKIGAHGSGGGNNSEGGTAGFTTINGTYVCLAAYPQVQVTGQVGGREEEPYGRDQITLYACNLSGSGKAAALGMIKYEAGLAPTSDGGEGSSTSGTPYGGYSSIEYRQTKDGEYCIVMFEDALGITISNISDFIPRGELFCGDYASTSGVEQKVEEIAQAAGYITQAQAESVIDQKVAQSAGGLVTTTLTSEVNYIGESSLGPVYITDVKADLARVEDDGSIVDLRTGVKYPKSNTGTNKPKMGTGSDSGLIIYDSAGASSNAERAYTDIYVQEGVFGLPSTYTIAFEFKYEENGSAGWPAVFRAYSDNSTASDKQIYGVNVRKGAGSNGEIVFNPFGMPRGANTFRMQDPTGNKQGDIIHYAITIKSDGKQLHYVNGVEVNTSTAYSGETGTSTNNLPAPGVGWAPSNSFATIKRLVIANDAGGLVSYKVGFGNLKFYNRVLTESEIQDLYRRRKEYLPALKTSYKEGFVGAINEVQEMVSSTYDDVLAMIPLVKGLVYDGSTLPAKENLIVNLTSEVFKRGMTKNGYYWNGDSTLRDIKDLGFCIGTQIRQRSFGDALNSGYGDGTVAHNTEDGFLYIGKTSRKTIIDLTSVGLLSSTEGFTVEVEIERVSDIAYAYADVFLMSALDTLSSHAGGGYAWNNGKCIKLESTNTGASGNFAVYTNQMNLNDVDTALLSGVANGTRMKVVFTMDTSNDLRVYLDYSSTPHNSSTRTNGIDAVKYLAFNTGYGTGEGSQFANIKVHKLRVWKGVALSGSQVQELASH